MADVQVTMTAEYGSANLDEYSIVEPFRPSTIWSTFKEHETQEAL